VSVIRNGVKALSVLGFSEVLKLSDATAVNQPQELASGRSRGRPAVPLDRILAAALELVDEQGADALSMRSPPQRLE